MQEIKNTEEYQNAISTAQPTVIKFYTTWCPDCTRLDQYIDEVIQKNEDKAWYSMDRDQFPEIGEQQAVLGIPSLLVFKDGVKIGHLRADRKSQEEIEEFLGQF